MEYVILKLKKDEDWFAFGQVKAKGYAFDSSGRYHKKNDLAQLFSDTKSLDELIQIANNLNGLFCIIGTLQYGSFAIVDKVRSTPVFYTKTHDQLIISDYPYDLNADVVFDEQAFMEFKTAGYTLGGSTLYKDVHQVEAASIAYFSGIKTSIVEYYNYTSVDLIPKDYGEYKKELIGILDRIMQRMIKSIDGRTIAIPLSGGYDSRFILAWLVKNGYPNVIAFTYGKNGNREMILAEKVAKELKVQWIGIPYEELISDFTDDVLLEDYIKFASNASSMPFFQDYPAVKYIRDNDLIPHDSVILPGHSGDFIAGSHLMPYDFKKTPDLLTIRIFGAHHSYYKISRLEASSIENKINRFFNNYQDRLPYSIMEWWDFKERQSKFIVNSCRAYDFFRYDIRLPFFDDELVVFFREVPFEFKLNKRLYDDVLENEYFKPLNISFAKELKPSPFDYKKRMVKEFLKQQIPFFKDFTKQEDIVCYTEIAEQLFKKYDFERETKFRQGFLNSSIIDWYLNFIRKISV